jgi:hypothetical protein
MIDNEIDHCYTKPIVLIRLFFSLRTVLTCLQDLAHNSFSTRLDNVFVIGQGKKANVTLPRGAGIRLTPLQELAHKNLQHK